MSRYLFSIPLCMVIILALLLVFPAIGMAVPASMLLGYNNGSNPHPHNLSSLNTSVGGIHAPAGGESQICIFCHTPHGASPTATPLWNRADPNPASFLLYANALEIKTIPEAKYSNSDPALYPNGSTRLCMSCHDGLTAVGTVLSGTLDGGLSMSAEGTVDLSTSHPVSFVYDSTVLTTLTSRPGHGNFLSPPGGWLDSENRMQCTTCHDPHVDTNDGTAYFLPMWRHYSGDENTDYITTCNTCHGAGAFSLPNPLNPGDGHQGGF